MRIGPRLVGGGIWAASGTLAGRGIHALTYVVLVRLLSTEAIGDMSLAAVVVNALALFPALGIGTALLTEKKDPRPLASAALSLSMLTGIGLAALSVGIGTIVARHKGDTVGLLVAIAGVSLAFRSISAVSSACLDRELRFATRSLSEAAGAMAFFVTSITLAAIGAGAMSIAWGLVASYAVPAFWQLAATGLRPQWDRTQWRALAPTARVGLVVLATSLLQWLFVSADALIIDSVFGRETLSHYVLALYFAALPASVLGLLASRLALPGLVHARDRQINAAHAFRESLRLASTISAVFVAVLVAAPTLVVTIALGPKYVPATSMLTVFAFYGFSKTLGSFGGPALLAAGRARFALGISVAQNILALSLVWPLSRTLGPVGVALAFTISSVAATTVALLVGSKTLGLSPLTCLRTAFVPLLALALPTWLLANTVGHAGALIGCGLAIALGALAAWNTFNRLGLRSPALGGGSS